MPIRRNITERIAPNILPTKGLGAGVVSIGSDSGSGVAVFLAIGDSLGVGVNLGPPAGGLV